MQAWRRCSALILGCVLAWIAAAAPLGAADFKNQTISMVVGAEPGGGTDAAARLVAPFFEKYLPGHPAIIIHNRPGAGGVTALNYVMQQTAPDGLTSAAATRS